MKDSYLSKEENNNVLASQCKKKDSMCVDAVFNALGLGIVVKGVLKGRALCDE